MIALVLLGGTLFCLYLWFYKLRRHRLLKMVGNIPTIPGELPIVGHLFQLLGDMSYLYTLVTEKAIYTNNVGGIVKFWIGPGVYFMVTDPKIAKDIANMQLQKPGLYKMASAWLGQGLITADVPIWKGHRKILNPLFNQQVLNGFMGVFNHNTKMFVESLKQHADKDPFDATDYIGRASVATYLQSIAGVSSKESLAMDKEFTEAITDIDHIYTARFQNLFRFKKIFNRTEFKEQEEQLIQYFQDFNRDVLNKKKISRESRNKTDLQEKSLIDLLLQLQENGSFTDQEIKDELTTIAVAATHTVALSFMYCLIALGSYPDVQKRVFDEVKGVFPNVNMEVSKDDLPKLSYTEAVIKETLRLYPVTPVIGRSVTREMKFDKFTIPGGTDVVFCVWGMNRQNALGDPHDFRPERWLEPNSSAEVFTFSLGVRNCIGKQYAMMFMKTLVAHTVRKYRLKADCSKLKFKIAINSEPVTGQLIEIKQRKE